MKNLYKRECELKFRVLSHEHYKILLNKMLRAGFELHGSHVETDFTPDVYDFSCRRNSIILRFRLFESKTSNYLTTLKIAKPNDLFQEFIEIEYYSDIADRDKHSEINRILSQHANISIPEDLDIGEDIFSLVSRLYQIGFVHCRMLSQKKRSLYKKKGISICFDEFPKAIGTYMEIEANSEVELNRVVANLKLDRNQSEHRNYGKLIQDIQMDMGVPEKQRRVCVFDADIEHKILGQFELLMNN